MKHNLSHPPLWRPIRVEQIKDAAQGEIEATQAELTAIAKLLELKGLERLSFAYRFNRSAGGRLRLTGRLTSSVTQTCVVSLEPVEASLDVPVEVEFWPAELIKQLERSAEGPGQLDWPEPIVDGKIVLGPFIYETLATSLDPYPRKQGVSLDWSQGDAERGEVKESGPFAAIEELKRR
jgi:Large ribosomal RNA subunit accumulation protein YceD